MSSLRDRLNAVKESKKASPLSKSLFPSVGGLDADGAAILPNLIGKELVWVKSPASICGGRIGSSGCKGCLKSIGECDVESHERTKCEFPSSPFLVLMVNFTSNKGYEM